MKRWTCKPRLSALTLATLAALASPLLSAQEVTPNTGMYVGISAGESQSTIDNVRITQSLLGSGLTTNVFSEDRRDPGYKAYLGFPINPYWAVEAGYFDLGRFGFNATTTPAGTLTGTTRIQGLNLDLVATLPITERGRRLRRHAGQLHRHGRCHPE
jgi:OOP family OmpA-OmpF porin